MLSQKGVTCFDLGQVTPDLEDVEQITNQNFTEIPAKMC